MNKSKFNQRILIKTKDNLNLKDHKIQINYQDNFLALEGFGKIKFEKED